MKKTSRADAIIGIFGFKDLTAKPITVRQLTITVVFIVSFVLSNILVMRQIAGPFGLVMAGSTFVFPITYIISDIFSEVYGYNWSRFTCVLALLCNLLVVLVSQLVIIAPVPEVVDVPVEAFATIFGTAWRTLLASAVAYFFGDWINDIIFSKMKKRHNNSDRLYIVRSLVSSAGGTIVDIFIFYSIALTGILSVRTLISIGIVDFCTKMIYEIVCSPVNKFIMRKFKQSDRIDDGVNVS